MNKSAIAKDTGVGQLAHDKPFWRSGEMRREVRRSASLVGCRCPACRAHFPSLRFPRKLLALGALLIVLNELRGVVVVALTGPTIIHAMLRSLS